MYSRLTILLLASLLLMGCENEPDAQSRETQTQQAGYEGLVESQPASEMSYSPTRETINFWIDTWDEPNKLSYVYLLASNGQMVGYYVFEGLPVSYCASLTPTYRRIAPTATGGGLIVPAPAMDGVYYSGAQCDVYYGKDATTGTYMEFTAGLGLSTLIYEEPLPRQDVEPLGFTTIEDIDD